MAGKTIVVCSWDGDGSGAVADEIGEVLTLARKIAGDEAPVWLVVGGVPPEAASIAARFGVGRIDRIEADGLDEFRPDLYVAALADYVGQVSPDLLLMPQTFDARLLAPRLAGRIGAGVVMNVVDVDATSVTTAAFGGDTRVIYDLAGADCYIVGVAANAVAPEELEQPGPPPEVRSVSVDLGGVQERIRVVERAITEGPRLEHAQVIVAGGRGLGERDNFRLVEELAEALGGLAGASRPIVDDGWVDSAHQVGLTGKITKPALYIAAGISGATQHMVGCSAAKTLVAINTDADAAVFRYARYGIVGNCLEVLPEITKAVKES